MKIGQELISIKKRLFNVKLQRTQGQVGEHRISSFLWRMTKEFSRQLGAH